MDIQEKYRKKLLRKKRVRAKVFGTSQRPRVSVFRSLRHIYAQIINDEEGKTICAASSLELKKELENKKLTKTQIAEKVGEILAKKALDKGIKKIVFDRGPYKYHGRVKALAEALRKEGLEF